MEYLKNLFIMRSFQGKNEIDDIKYEFLSMN